MVSTSAWLTSRSCASSCGSTGSLATNTMASKARRVSSFKRSTFVTVDTDQHGRLASVSTDPRDFDVAEPLRLVKVNHALLVQLQHGQKVHDDLDSLREGGGEAPEADAAFLG